MSGLAAILARSAPAAVDVVQRMLEAAPHRGRDVEIVSSGNAVLGVSNDPETNESSIATSNGIVAAFSGALDNRLELNRELERAGQQVCEQSPAATVLAAFQAWGDAMPSHLRGVFAATVTDGNKLW